MDESEYKSARDTLITAPCAFEKSILALKTQCSKAMKRNIAEREVVMCTSANCASRCQNWLTLLRKKSQFSLHISAQTSVLPHSKEMKVQVGGILGVSQTLALVSNNPGLPPDVSEVLDVYDERVATDGEIPFAEIIQEVQHFRLR